MQITLSHFITLSAVVFAIGLFGALSKRNMVSILMCIELMFNAVNIALIAFSRYQPSPSQSSQLAGQILALFIITVSAAEASVALAIILTIYRTRRTVDVEEVNLLKW